METKDIEQALKDAIESMQPCWEGQIGATLPAMKLLSAENYLKAQLDALYRDAFSDPEAK